VIPVLTTVIVGGAFVLALGQPISWVFSTMSTFLTGLQGGSAIVLGLILGAMVAFDMGGPVNKTAFLFGSALIATGNPAPMGMVAAAIAVPPLGMGLATLIRGRYFSKPEREAGIAALFMGFFGITEGAIPLAAAKPLQVIPANMIGGAVAGGIAALFAVTDSVPHGGPIVAVFGAVSGVPMYFAALLIGAVVTALVSLLLLGVSARRAERRAPRVTGSAPAVVDPTPTPTPNDSPAPASALASISAADAPSPDLATVTAAAAPASDLAGPQPVPTPAPARVPAPKTVLEYIDEDTIVLDAAETDRDAMIRTLVGRMGTTGRVTDAGVVIQAALAREELGTTAVGDGIAIPHAKSDGVSSPILAFARSRHGVDWTSPDGTPATLIFLIAVPEAAAGTEHLKVLAQLSRALMKPAFRATLQAAATPADVLAALAAQVGPKQSAPVAP